MCLIREKKNMSQNDGWPFIHRAESVASRPTENLICWSIFEAIFSNRDISHHLIGFIPGRNGRVTSAIQQFCPKNRQITTKSGRLYNLLGMPGSSEDGLFVWQHWCTVNSVIYHKDVTDDYTKQIKNLVM